MLRWWLGAARAYIFSYWTPRLWLGGRWSVQIFVWDTEMVVRGRPHTQFFVLWTDIRPRFFSYFSKIDFSPNVRTASGRPARPFFSPFFLPCFPLCPIFFIFRSNFAFWVTSSNVSLDIHGLILILIEKGARARDARARFHENSLPPHPARYFWGAKFPIFSPDP